MNKKVGNAGFSLIEVMVAALVMGVGLMGVLSLQSRSVQFNQQAYYMSQANILARDISERMGVNRESAVNYRVNSVEGLSSSLDCGVVSCSAEEIAVWDIADWGSSIQRILPGGDAEIGQGVSLDSFYVVIRFDGEKNFSDSNVDQEIRLDFKL